MLLLVRVDRSQRYGVAVGHGGVRQMRPISHLKHLKLILSHGQGVPGCVLLSHVNLAPLRLPYLSPRAGYDGPLMYHLHVDGRCGTLILIVGGSSSLLAYGHHARWGIRCAQPLHLTARLSGGLRAYARTYLLGVLRLLHLYCFPLHLTGRLRGLHTGLRSDRGLCAPTGSHQTVLPLGTVYFGDGLLDLGDVDHGLLV